MEKSKILIGIGYWHSIYEPDLPDPGLFVDENWCDTDRKKLIKYLNSGFKLSYSYMGSSWCRFRCGQDDLGSLEYTDGKYVWPEGLVHYIEKHMVRLPSEVEAYMLNNSNVGSSVLNPEIDLTWWKKQKPVLSGVKTYRDILDIGKLHVTQIDKSFIGEQKAYLVNYLGRCFGVKERLKLIDEIIRREKVEIKGRFIDVENALGEILKIGLKAKFEEMIYEDFIKE